MSGIEHDCSVQACGYDVSGHRPTRRIPEGQGPAPSWIGGPGVGKAGTHRPLAIQLDHVVEQVSEEETLAVVGGRQRMLDAQPIHGLQQRYRDSIELGR